VETKHVLLGIPSFLWYAEIGNFKVKKEGEVIGSS